MNVTEPTVIRLDESEKVAFSSNSYYQPILTNEVGDLPIFTGIQTAEPGYQTPPHSLHHHGLAVGVIDDAL